jgi:hypothetical protein
LVTFFIKEKSDWKEFRLKDKFLFTRISIISIMDNNLQSRTNPLPLRVLPLEKRGRAILRINKKPVEQKINGF